MKKLILLFLVFLTLGVGCTDNSSQDNIQQETSKESIQKTIPSWFNYELKDVSSGEKFTINDYKGKIILLESFAVWCPVCTLQERETKILHEELGDSFISISLDTDPNEPESKILEHIKRNEFNWIFSQSPVELTRIFIKEFNVGIVNAPASPMILICPDQSYRMLEEKGVKSSETLKKEINTCN